MNRERLFEYLKKEKKEILFTLLQSAYDEMETNQRHRVFDNIITNIPPKKVNGTFLLKKN